MRFLFISFLIIQISPLYADNIQLCPGDSITIANTTVACSHNVRICYGSFSDASCQGSPQGSLCAFNSEKAGVCVQSSTFVGEPVCKCLLRF